MWSIYRDKVTISSLSTNFSEKVKNFQKDFFALHFAVFTAQDVKKSNENKTSRCSQSTRDNIS